MEGSASGLDPRRRDARASHHTIRTSVDASLVVVVKVPREEAQQRRAREVSVAVAVLVGERDDAEARAQRLLHSHETTT